MARPARSRKDRTAVAILEAASRVLARQGQAATINDVAGEAGIGRATVYRYFETREQLVSALWEAALSEVDERLVAARLEQVPFEEGLARLVRAIAGVGERYAVLLGEQSREELERGREVLGDRVFALLERGQEGGALRGDVPLVLIAEMFGGMVLAGLREALERGLGIEEASAAVVSVFLTGAGRSQDAKRRSTTTR
ncbi:MAG TPA: TetR family transcriptional regulator [Gaiellaceae bacterium]|jgi:TetR/AcrR family transcriptional regulator, mexCD-oprJ operon repressor